MSDAPERIWAKWKEDFGAVQIGTWADTVRFEPLGIEYVRADMHAAAIARAERAETALAIAEEALRGAIAAIDAAYDGPDDNGAYTVRERAALAKIKALKGGVA